MPSIGSNSKPAYVYDAGTDTWIPIGPGEHTHDYIGKDVITTTGDLIYASAANTPARLGIGSNGQVLKVSGGVPSWGADGGKVLQVVSATTSTTASTTVNTFIDTNLTATITPSSATSKILVILFQNGLAKNAGSAATYGELQLLRGASVLAKLEGQFVFTNSIVELNIGSSGTAYLDSPNTTSATTYKTQFKNVGAAGLVIVQGGNAVSTITLLEIGA